MNNFGKIVERNTRTTNFYCFKMLPSKGGNEAIFDTFVNARFLNWENPYQVHNLYGTLRMGKEKISTFLGKGHKKTEKPVSPFFRFSV